MLDIFISIALFAAGAATIAVLPWSDEEIEQTADAAYTAFFAAVRAVTNPLFKRVK